MKHTGVVARINTTTKTKAGKVLRSPLYSFAIDDTWFSCGFDKPLAEEGSLIEFSYEEDDYGKQVDVASIKVLDAGSPAAKSAGATITPDARQLSIVYQSSRKDAIALITLAADKELVKLPKTTGYDALLGLVEDLTVEFTKKAMNPVLGDEPKSSVVEDNDE